ncbi:hypothetical protein NHH03_21385 [Stieleria sp. TO1_6]|uniref:hypothetical protein n=1 Tax=Stieleria tagensis TaxID=2956795 RepID=UPI00209B1C13|nr:hypothetical protein [Stieleria tagensis]MCO8124308.1 hypothetical protein [Stieleria tagensis]
MNDSEIHSGYEFEDGMFSRMRSWVDVAPWIRLGRVCRILASPSNVGLVFLGVILTVMVLGWGLGVFAQRARLTPLMTDMQQLAGLVIGQSVLKSLFAVGFLVLLWTPIVQFVCRSGASLTAGMTLPDNRSSGQIVRTRCWWSYLVPIVPWLCLLTFALLLFLVRIPSLLVNVPLLSILSGGCIGLLAIPAGVLGFGALFAIPLGLAAMVNEPDPDPIDSLSRGYEYLFRRPLSVVWYGLVSGVLIYLSGYLLGGVCAMALLVVGLIGGVGGADPRLIASAATVVGWLLTAWQLTFAFGLLGGVYLLLRRDAGGQEVEDLWLPPQPATKPLPSLPKQAFDS